MRRLSIITWACAGLLAACGGKTITGLSSTSSSGTSSSGTTTIVSMGSGSGSAFESGVIAIGTASLSAGGSTSLTVALVDQTGAPYTTSTAITFSSPCVGQGLASITVPGAVSPGQTITTTTGTASVTYVASGCSGSDVITASAQTNSQNLTATGTITVQKATVGSISFISATPSNITLKGTGATTGSGGTSTATSTVVFKVLDSSGGPSPNATVTFTPTTTVGGITITPTSGTTDATGQIQTIVTGGTVATTVRITATTTTSAGASISTQSSALTISTGIPTSGNVSLAVTCPNIEAYNEDGETVGVTVSMTDRFSNPVPDNTTANFQTTLGGIQGTCQTGNPTYSGVPGSGACQVNWFSKTPYVINGNPQTTAGSKYLNTKTNYCVGPANSPSQRYCNSTTNGRSPIYITAVGEESFVDANGNGIFDPADTVAIDPLNKDNDFANGTPKPWFDTSEPFLNEWEIFDTYGTPTYVSGEPFIDFNNNGTRDGPDGLFNGTLCEGPLCAPSGKQSAAISANNIIIASTPNASFTIASVSPAQTINQSAPSFSFGGAATMTINMWIYDQNYQQMAAGTTVGVAIVGTNPGTIPSGAPAIPAWPCSSTPPTFDSSGNVASAGQLYSFTLVAPVVGGTTPATSGILYVTVTSTRKSNGAKTVTTIPISINP